MNKITKKIIIHDLVNVYNYCEPMDESWISKVDAILEKIRQEAKRKVFDDLYFGENKGLLVVGETPCLQHFFNGGIDIMKEATVIEALRKYLDYFIESKERHLSTFEKQKEHN